MRLEYRLHIPKKVDWRLIVAAWLNCHQSSAGNQPDDATFPPATSNQLAGRQ
jgi:hypothetical protein